MNVRVMSARSGAPACPADDDRTARRTPAGMSRTTPWLQQRAGQLREAVVGGQDGAAVEQRTDPFRRRALARSAMEVERRRRRRVASATARRPVTSPSVDHEQAVASRSGRSVVRPGAVRGDRRQGRRRRAGRVAQVEVGRVERVRSRPAAPRTRRSRRAGRRAARPARRRVGAMASMSARSNRQREVGQSLACRARPR